MVVKKTAQPLAGNALGSDGGIVQGAASGASEHGVLKKRSVRREHGFLGGMTRREHEVACLAAEGLYNQEIAERLGMSVNTVKTHLKKAYRKTGVSSRPGLREIMKGGYVEEHTSPVSGDIQK